MEIHTLRQLLWALIAPQQGSRMRLPCIQLKSNRGVSYECKHQTPSKVRQRLLQILKGKKVRLPAGAHTCAPISGIGCSEVIVEIAEIVEIVKYKNVGIADAGGWELTF